MRRLRGPVAAFDPMGTSGAAYLEPLSSVVTPATAAIVVGTTPDEPIATARASYRRSRSCVGTCQFNGVAERRGGHRRQRRQRALDDCATERREEGIADGVLLMSQGSFQRIAELTAAPIHVEIRQ